MIDIDEIVLKCYKHKSFIDKPNLYDYDNISIINLIGINAQAAEDVAFMFRNDQTYIKTFWGDINKEWDIVEGFFRTFADRQAVIAYYMDLYPEKFAV